MAFCDRGKAVWPALLVFVFLMARPAPVMGQGTWIPPAREDPPGPWLAGEGMPSMKSGAVIHVGGEAYVDAAYATRTRAPEGGDPAAPTDGRQHATDFQARNVNLRFNIQPSHQPDVSLMLKLSLTDAWEGDYDQDDLLEECRFIFNNVGGTGWSILFGKGEVPFGQDRTLGVLQSYGHNAAAYDSREGPISLLANRPALSPSGDPGLRPVGLHGLHGKFPHPGEVDRVFFGGVSWRWRDRLLAEFALFQDDRRLEGLGASDYGFQSAAARVWWTPVERLTLQGSFLRRHSRWMGNPANRNDLLFGHLPAIDVDAAASARKAEYAASFGIEWTPGPWDLFAEYIHGWNQNHTRGFKTHQISVGALYQFMPCLQGGLMGEWLRLSDRAAGMDREHYSKLIASLRYSLPGGMFMIGEIGHEWFRGRYGAIWPQRRANATMAAFRLGWQF